MNENEMDGDELEWNADDVDGDLGGDDGHRRGAGVRVFSLISKQAFDYSFLASSAVVNVTIRRALKVPRLYYYWLGLRIHNRDIVRGTYDVQLFETLPSRQDPQEFTSAAASLSLTCSEAGADVPPVLETVMADNLGPYVEVVLQATQNSSSGDRFYAELSAVLYGRPA